MSTTASDDVSEAPASDLESDAPDKARHTCDVVLRDGTTLHVRPIEPGDVEKLLGLYQKLSEESLYFRFFAVPKPDPNRLAFLTNVDYQDRFALVGELNGEVVAVARYDRDPRRPDHAEAAFITADALQGKGIGTRLLEELAEIARAKGINTFEAEVLGGNAKMLDVFVNSGFEIEKRMDAGVFHISMSIRPTRAFEEQSSERARTAASASMRAFFEPKSVAVVGAARKRGSIGSEILYNLRSGGYTGALWAVNGKVSAGDTIDGVPAVPRVADIPGELDLAIISVPGNDVPGVVDEALGKGVKAVVVISAGFSELGAEGRRREEALVDAIRQAGVRMIGPNCMGLLNTDPAVKLNATFAPTAPTAGRVAFSSQSGALGVAVLEHARRLNLGISTFVSMGNKADVSGNDLLQYWAEDPRTDVILLYLESFGNPQHFSRLARRIARKKPIVAVKAGRSKAGARAAQSHTGALATSDAVIDDLFRQAGVIRTVTLEELFDVATLLAHQPLPKGNRVAILTNAGGPAILAADACEANGLEIPTLAEETQKALRLFLPAAAAVSNPVDMIASASGDDYRSALALLLRDPNVDAVIAIFIPPILTKAADVARAIVEGSREASGKPVVANFCGGQGMPPEITPIPCYVFPESAARALGQVADYAAWRRRPEGIVPALPDIDAEAVKRVVADAISRGGGWLAPAEVNALLSAAGIAVAPSRFVTSATQAAEAAKEIGFPVALKAVGPSILHKTEVGGVKLSLGSASAVKAADREMKRRIGAQMTGAVVQKMISGGVEVMVGATHDATFGPLVAYGSGGVLVELLEDVAFRIHPVTDRDVDDMLDEVKGTVLLRGHRGAEPADIASLREAILRVSALLEISPDILEMEINPLKVLARGLVAVDARVRVGKLAYPASRRIRY
ncbi:MAG TPA: GNAT family N-acetyltransferase [Thermoanaerobaculia bacterium]|nr:GNAT family N-acetyltransferase [Thermoanaerobaculia bacterium]